jgi:hypothetical protein
MANGRLSIEYFKLATQYYVSARFSALAQLMPVTGNLFHHALELFLKGSLSSTIPSPQLKKKYGHRLQALWEEFKNAHSDPELNSFEPVIKSLDQFENIRYPESLVEGGGELIVQPTTLPETRSLTPRPSPLPRHQIVLQQLDTLVYAILQRSDINPEALFMFPTRDAREYLFRSNQAFKEPPAVA